MEIEYKVDKSAYYTTLECDAVRWKVGYTEETKGFFNVMAKAYLFGSAASFLVNRWAKEG